MNARQKAKKYKKELDRLKGMTVKPFCCQGEELEVRTLRITRNAPDYRMRVWTAQEHELMLKEMVHQFATLEEFKDAVRFSYVRHPVDPLGRLDIPAQYVAEMQVVIPERGSLDA